MKLEEIYNYYGQNWAQISRELDIGTTTVQNWRKRGYIPIVSQVIIEKKTNGKFKANLDHCKPEE